MNIFFYYKHLCKELSVKRQIPIEEKLIPAETLYALNAKATIQFTARRFPSSQIFLITDDPEMLNVEEPNLTVIPPNKNLSPRHKNLLEHYFHFNPDGHISFILVNIQRWFDIYDTLISHGIKNFIQLDLDCILLEDASPHNYKKIGINHPPHSQDCWPNALMCSTANLNQFLDFTCSFYEGVQQHITKARQKQNSTPSLRVPLKEGEGIKYISSFFNKPKNGFCDMGLWYLFKKQNPDLFINNLIIDAEDKVHDIGLGYEPSVYGNFMTREAQKHNQDQNLETVRIKEIFHTEDGPCFEEKNSGKLIKIKSLHFTPGAIKFNIIPFIQEYEKIYGFPH
jgi:hypothetical protein